MGGDSKAGRAGGVVEFTVRKRTVKGNVERMSLFNRATTSSSVLSLSLLFSHCHSPTTVRPADFLENCHPDYWISSPATQTAFQNLFVFSLKDSCEKEMKGILSVEKYCQSVALQMLPLSRSRPVLSSLVFHTPSSLSLPVLSSTLGDSLSSHTDHDSQHSSASVTGHRERWRERDRNIEKETKIYCV